MRWYRSRLPTLFSEEDIRNQLIGDGARDALGGIVEQAELPSMYKTVRVDVSGLPTVIYYVGVRGEAGPVAVRPFTVAQQPAPPIH